MTWEDVLRDVELQLGAALDAELAGEVDQRRRAELGALRTQDRLRPLLGSTAIVTVGLAGHEPVTGRVAGLGLGWLLLAATSAEVLVVLGQATWIDGLSGRAEPIGETGCSTTGSPRVTRNLDLRHALRTLARDRSPATLMITAGSEGTVSCWGTIDVVGADHLLVAVHAPGQQRRASEVSRVRLVPLDAVVAVSRPSGA